MAIAALIGIPVGAAEAVKASKRTTTTSKPKLAQELILQAELTNLLKTDNDLVRKFDIALKETYLILPPHYQEVFDNSSFNIPPVDLSEIYHLQQKIDITKQHIHTLRGAILETQQQIARWRGISFPEFPRKRRDLPFAPNLAGCVLKLQRLSACLLFSIMGSIQIPEDDTLYALDHADHDVFVPLYPEVIRHKRLDFGTAFSVGTKIVGTFMGLFNSIETKRIATRVSTLEHAQSLVYQVTQRQERELNILQENFLTLTAQLQNFIEFNPALFYAKLNDQLLEFEMHVNRIINTIQQLQHRRLAVDWLDDQQLHNLHQSVSNYAKVQKYTLLTHQLSDYFQLETSYLRDGAEVTAVLHVPCILSPSMMTIYRYVPFPIPLPEPSPSSSVSIRDSLYPTRLSPDEPLPPLDHSPITSAEALYLVADADMIAIDEKDNFRLLSQSDLAGCIQRNHVYLCDQQHVLRTNLSETCLGSLYHKLISGVRSNCKFDKRPLVEQVFQLTSNDYIVFSITPLKTRLSCLNGSSYTAEFGQTTLLSIPDGCEIRLRTHILRVDEKFHLPMQPEVSQWKWQPLDLPSDLLDRAGHIDQNLHDIQQNLRRLRNDSTLDNELPELVDHHLGSGSWFGVLVWTLLFLTTLTPLATTGWYLYRRYRRITRHRRYPNVYATVEHAIAPVEMQNLYTRSAPPIPPSPRPGFRLYPQP